MLEEDFVQQEMRPKVEGLVKEFEGWISTIKVLRNVRWRLKGVKRMMG